MMTYYEIGTQLGISPGRVRQIEQRALLKLKKAFLRIGVVDFRESGSCIAERKNQHQRQGS